MDDPPPETKTQQNVFFKKVARLVARHRRTGTGEEKIFTGEALKTLKDTKLSSNEGFSDTQNKYIEHHTTTGGDAKRRRLEEKQRGRSIR